jgi:hypothetical protein
MQATSWVAVRPRRWPMACLSFLKPLSWTANWAKVVKVIHQAMAPQNPSNIVDLAKVSGALKTLETTKVAELATLWVALENFKNSVGADLNKAEFRQLMTTLFNDQVVTEAPVNLEEKESEELNEPVLATIAGGFIASKFQFRQPDTVLMTGNFRLRAVI